MSVVKIEVRNVGYSDRFTIRYAPSCQILKYCVDRSPATVTQYGTVENADGTLPGAGYEGEKVATLFDISTDYRLQGRERATIANFISLLKQPISHCLLANHAQSRLDKPLVLWIATRRWGLHARQIDNQSFSPTLRNLPLLLRNSPRYDDNYRRFTHSGHGISLCWGARGN